MCVLYSDAINLYFTANHLQTAERDPEDSVCGVPGPKYLSQLYQGPHPQTTLWHNAGTTRSR